MQSHQTRCSNTRSVNVIRAGKPRSTWKNDMELDMDVDIEGFQNTASVIFSNSQSNVFPSFPNNPNSISNKLSSISLDGKRMQEYGILPHSRTYYYLLFSLYHMFIIFVISY